MAKVIRIRHGNMAPSGIRFVPKSYHRLSTLCASPMTFFPYGQTNDCTQSLPTTASYGPYIVTVSL